MKKLFSVIVIAAFGFAACDSGDSADTKTTSDTVVVTTPTDTVTVVPVATDVPVTTATSTDAPVSTVAK